MREPGKYGIIAQLGEHLPYKQRVIGSSPIGPILIKIFLYGGIAQLARAHGSYPWCRWFKSSSRYFKKTCSCKSFYIRNISSTYGQYFYGGIAQLARAHGSYPWCRWFKSSSRYFKRLAIASLFSIHIRNIFHLFIFLF